jgi:hypothetical protein
MTKEELAQDVARDAERALIRLLVKPDDPERLEDVTWAGITCLLYLLHFGERDPVGQVVRLEFERIKGYWDPEPEWN